MKIEKVIKQLESSILDHTRSMAASPDADDIWKEDIDALEFALTALCSMLEAGKKNFRVITQADNKDMDAPTNSVWISVKDQLPERFKPVLICREKNGKPYVEQGYKDVCEWWKVYGTRTKQVTHWMPLPEPPEEG